MSVSAASCVTWARFALDLFSDVVCRVNLVFMITPLVKGRLEPTLVYVGICPREVSGSTTCGLTERRGIPHWHLQFGSSGPLSLSLPICKCSDPCLLPVCSRSGLLLEESGPLACGTLPSVMPEELGAKGRRPGPALPTLVLAAPDPQKKHNPWKALGWLIAREVLQANLIKY